MLAPQCKDQIDQIEKKMKGLQDENMKQHAERSNFNENLREIRKNRQDQMFQVLSLLQDEIDLTYRELTRKSQYVFGKANLYIHDKVDPFKSGIDYIPNPPGKRAVYSVNQLSSGEKTIAMLAFQLTLLQKWSVPFLVLDEADAHLDEEHLATVMEFVK